MKVKSNKFQKGDVVFWTLPDRFCYLADERITVKVKTAFPVGDSYRYLVKVFLKSSVTQLGGSFFYVDEKDLESPDVVNGNV